MSDLLSLQRRLSSVVVAGLALHSPFRAAALEARVDQELVPTTGNEYYYAPQRIANGWFSEQDTTIVGLCYVDRESIDTYVLDLNTRFLLTKDPHFNPRLRFSYQNSDVLSFEEHAIQLSAVFDYYITKDWSIELELGTKWSERDPGAAVDDETEYIFTLGYRHEFYAEHRDD